MQAKAIYIECIQLTEVMECCKLSSLPEGPKAKSQGEVPQRGETTGSPIDFSFTSVYFNTNCILFKSKILLK